ncbi:MAG: acyltransferase [Ruminococcaceae bacterium]|nr:acyltransferase [Oscillospiraceae bacterium]
MNTVRSRNVYLDIFKFFLCYLVIAIHLAGETYAHFPLYRLAVPMFFIISGYFNRTADRERAEKMALGFIKRTLRYLIAGFLLYIVFDFVLCFVNGNGVGYYFTTLFYEDFLLEFFILNRPITYTGAQLWFLIALFVVSLIHFALVKLRKLSYYKIIVPVCYGIYFFFAGYMYLIQNTDMPIRYTRNALFFGLPNFGLGYLLAGVDFHKKKWYKYLYLVLGILFFYLQIHEYHLVKTPYCSLEMYWCGILSAVFLLQFFLGIKNAGCDFYYKWVGKNGAFWVYILHMAVAVVLSKLRSFDNLMVKSLWVLAISFAIYEAVHLLLMLPKARRAER